MELQITVIPLLELVFIVTQKLEEVFGAGVLRNSCAGPDTCNHSGVGAGAWSHSRAGVAVWRRLSGSLRDSNLCLESFRSRRSYLKLPISVIPQLELVFIVTPEVGEM